MNRGKFKDASGTVTAGTTAQTALAANANRGYLLFQNNSTGDLWINFGVTAVATQPSILVPMSGSFVWEGRFVPTDLLSVYGATTGQAFTIKEG